MTTGKIISFSDLEKGDKLLKHVREVAGRLGQSWRPFQKWVVDEYVEVTVEKATKVFYWIEGEKHRKDEGGRPHGSWRSKNLFILPFDKDGVPVYRYSAEELAKVDEAAEKITRFLITQRLNNAITQKLSSLDSIESAACFADRMYEAHVAMERIEAELDEAIKLAGE